MILDKKMKQEEISNVKRRIREIKHNIERHNKKIIEINQRILEAEKDNDFDTVKKLKNNLNERQIGAASPNFDGRPIQFHRNSSQVGMGLEYYNRELKLFEQRLKDLESGKYG